MKRVLLLATGDTIAFTQHSSRPGVASGAELLAGAGVSTVDVIVEDVLAEPGWDISTSTMLALARRVRAALVDEQFDGVVVTHGLDTLAESAFLTDLLAGPAVGRGGIVFTGARSCWDAAGSDGPGNLRASLTAAANPAVRGLGAVVCCAGELHAARWARPGGWGFSSAPHALLGRVDAHGVSITGRAPGRLPDVSGEPESDVALIQTYPGMSPSLLTAAADAGAGGIVLEGTGAGNVPGELLTSISELVEWGIPVVVTSRSFLPGCVHDSSRLAIQLGAIDAVGLDGGKARVALMVALGGGGQGVRDWFAHL